MMGTVGLYYRRLLATRLCHITCCSVSKELSCTIATQDVCRKRDYLYIIYANKWFLIIQKYSYSPERDDTLLKNTGHPFLRLIIYLHKTHVRRHWFVCMNTCGTLAGIHKADCRKNSRRTYRPGWEERTNKEKRKN